MIRKDNKRYKPKNDVAAIVSAPLNDKLAPKQRFRSSLELSDLVVKMAVYIIGHTLIDFEDQLKDERLSAASAFLQRVMSTHICNHKLTKEGIEYQFGGEVFRLHEEYKTMTLTRSVYEHLTVFYFLFIHPKTDEERELAWTNWKTNNKEHEDDWRVSYSKAWQYLFRNREMAQLYAHLSMHSHPVYNGLLQYQSQAQTDEGYDGIPLYLSTCFLAYLCRLFLQLIPDCAKQFEQDFTPHDRQVFVRLSQL